MDFTEEEIQAVWDNGIIVSIEKAPLWRIGLGGAWICRDNYADRESIYGWEIDHCYPQSLGGGHDLINLQPMHWKNNLSKGNDFPTFKIVLKHGYEKNVVVEEEVNVPEELSKKLENLYKF